MSAFERASRRIGGYPRPVVFRRWVWGSPGSSTLGAAAIAEGIDQVLREPTAAQAMGQAGRRLVAERYTWERVAVQCEAMYQAARTACSGSA